MLKTEKLLNSEIPSTGKLWEGGGSLTQTQTTRELRRLNAECLQSCAFQPGSHRHSLQAGDSNSTLGNL